MKSRQVTPLGYAAITVLPIALGLVSPWLWGRLWDHDSSLAFVIAPGGEMFGAVLLAAGLYMHADEAEASNALLANGFLFFGFLFISFCKAGVSIAEFSTVGRLSGKYSACAFALVILAKHALGMLMSPSGTF